MRSARTAAHRHREWGQDGEGVGRQDRRRGSHAQGAHRAASLACVQPGRRAHRHRQRGQYGEGVGPRTGRRGPHPQGTHGRRHSVAFSPDGTRIVSGSCGPDGEGVGRAERHEILTLKGHTWRLSVSVRSARTASASSPASWDKTAKVWERGAAPRSSRSRATRGDLFGVRSARTAHASSPAADDKTAKVWDAERGASSSPSRGTPRRSLRRAFSPDGTRIVTGEWGPDGEGVGRGSGAEVLTLKGHTAAVTQCAFSPDGKRIVTGS